MRCNNCGCKYQEGKLRCNKCNAPLQINNYIVVEQISEDGFTISFKVIDKYSGKFSVLKISQHLSFDNIQESDIKIIHSWFRDEVYSPIRCNNDYFVKINDSGFFYGNLYYVMDYYSNGNLLNLIGNVPLDQVKDLALEILKGLQYLHQNRIAHLDLKPENILFDAQNKVLFSDVYFGRDQIGGPKGDIGDTHPPRPFFELKKLGRTFSYSLINWKRKEDFPYRDNIFSFGVILYELIVGELPYGLDPEFAGFYNNHVENIKKGKWNKEALIQKDPNKQWYTIIDKCLRYNERKRFQNIEEIISKINNTTSKNHIRTFFSKRWFIKNL